jgi:hypothetical protein
MCACDLHCRYLLLQAPTLLYYLFLFKGKKFCVNVSQYKILCISTVLLELSYRKLLCRIIIISIL